MPSYNNIILMGHLGADPEFRVTTGGTAVARVRLATNSSHRGKDEQWVEETDWHRIVLWGAMAERVRDQVTKGDLVFVTGRMMSRPYVANDGAKRTSYEVKARTFSVVSRRNSPDATWSSDGTAPATPTNGADPEVAEAVAAAAQAASANGSPAGAEGEDVPF